MLVGTLTWSLLSAVANKHEEGSAVSSADNRFVELSKLAGSDDPVAQYRLARMYRYGDGVAQDSQQERTWLERAANRGNTDAQFELGMVMREGKGVIQDSDGGLKWLRMAANGGNADAQNEVGLMYFSGRGIPQDYVAAYVWLNLAAAGGVIAAARTRDTVMRLLSPADVAAAQLQARQLSEAQSRASAR
jgi:TPR repeat protein